MPNRAFNESLWRCVSTPELGRRGGNTSTIHCLRRAKTLLAWRQAQTSSNTPDLLVREVLICLDLASVGNDSNPLSDTAPRCPEEHNNKWRTLYEVRIAEERYSPCDSRFHLYTSTATRACGQNAAFLSHYRPIRNEMMQIERIIANGFSSSNDPTLRLGITATRPETVSDKVFPFSITYGRLSWVYHPGRN